MWGLLLIQYRWPEDLKAPALRGFLERMQRLDYVKETLAVEQEALRTKASKAS